MSNTDNYNKLFDILNNKVIPLEMNIDKLKDENEQLKNEIKLLNIKLSKSPSFDFNKYRNDPNEYLFYEVWHNKTIRNIIFEQVRLYKTHGELTINSIQTLREFEHRTYLIKLIINGCIVNEGDIPSSVIELIAKDSTFRGHSIPNSVKTLIGINKLKDIPSSVTDLEFSNGFNEFIYNAIPSSVTKLSLGSSFNYKIDIGTLPLSITSLTLSDEFNQNLIPGSITPNVKTIIFGGYFNQPLEPGDLPFGLTSLTFNDGHGRWNRSYTKYNNTSFNHKIKIGTLPPTLTYLSFNNEFNNGDEPLEMGVFPQSLTYLKLGDSQFNQNIEPGVLPSSLITLVIYNKNYITHNSLPRSIKNII